MTKFQLWVLRWLLRHLLIRDQMKNSKTLFREYRTIYGEIFNEDNFYTREGFLQEAVTADDSFPELHIGGSK